MRRRTADIAFSYAPGKVILVGEHAVVYGASAIAMPIESGVRIAISRLPKSIRNEKKGPLIRGIGSFFIGDIFLGEDSVGPKILKRALEYLVKLFGDEARELAIVVDGSLPPGRGLGSSAALSVALIRGIYRYFSVELDPKILHEHALTLETLFHGRPSGIDHTVVSGGEVIRFKREEERALVEPIKLASSLEFVVGIVGPHEGTKNAVSNLRERKKRHEKVYEKIFSGLDEIAMEMTQALSLGRKTQIGELMNIAQGYLAALMVSTAELEKLCAIARDRGALGAKLTGAGGGGAIIALADQNAQEILGAFRAAGYQSFVTKVLSEMSSQNFCALESENAKNLIANFSGALNETI